MSKGRTPMPLEEVVVAALDLSLEDRVSLLELVEESLYFQDVAIDDADIEDSLRILEEIEAGRMKTVPADEVLEMLDRMASGS